jgi:hypothetical protein
MILPEPLPESQDLRLRFLYNWLNRMRSYVLSCTPQMPAGNIKLQRTPSGYTYCVPDTPPGSAPAAGGSTLYYFISESDNYIVCNPKQSGAEGFTTSANINVAKPYLLRRTSYDGLDARPPGTGSLTYSGQYGDLMQRIESANSVGEVIWEPYMLNDIIFADQPSGGTGVTVSSKALTWQDTNRDARKWAYQTKTSENGECGYYRVVVGSTPYTNPNSL